MDGTGDEKEEEAESLDGPFFLLTIGCSAIKVSPKLCCTKNLMRSSSLLDSKAGTSLASVSFTLTMSSWI